MRPLDPAAGPAELFACELRALRSAAGDLPFWKLAMRCAAAKSALAAAVAGYRIPSERVTREFVRACGGDWSQWRVRWLQAIADLDALAEGQAENVPDRYSLVLAQQRCLVPARDAGPDLREMYEGGPRLTGEANRPRMQWRLVMAAVATAVIAFPAGWTLGRMSAHARMRQRSGPARTSAH